MKKIQIFIFLCIFASCKPEKDTIGTAINIAGRQLDTKVLREYLPIEFQQNKSVVYVNQNMDTLLLNAYWNDNLTERVEGTEAYTSEDFNIIFYTPQIPAFRIIVSGSANFSQNKVVQSLGVIYYSDEKAPISFSRRFNTDGYPIEDLISPALETLTLNGKTFKACIKPPLVYSNTETKAIVYLNSTEGVPAFVDKNGNTYVFHGFQ